MLSLLCLFAVLIVTQYSNKNILKALFFAPIIVLVILAGLFIAVNHEYSLQGLLTVFGIMILIYITYCVIAVPIAYTVSVLLSRKYWLNFFTITLGAVVLWAIVSVIAYLVFTGSFPTPMWKIFTDWFFYAVAVFVGCCYWGFLKNLQHIAKLQTTDNVNKTDY